MELDRNPFAELLAILGNDEITELAIKARTRNAEPLSQLFLDELADRAMPTSYPKLPDQGWSDHTWP